MFILQVLAVAVYNHYKRIYHASLQKGLVFIFIFVIYINSGDHSDFCSLF